MKQVFKALLALVIIASFASAILTQYHLGLIALTCALITLFFLFPTDYDVKAAIIEKAQLGIKVWQSPIPYFILISAAVMYFAF
ncbi:hypothetical protein JQC92_00335 [Shewanella sp. 202IG2-18]|uniref:hypothetical protein n=1 Tax=Parashewanella hymeniacidonis TaxID=2807618 RepID=UPI0019612832|nr:hypothetical protein [Parashewanella hymeniacidonis]MBM7070500.1 hypothetical protein [Parashewanella hymeniacidonis]